MFIDKLLNIEISMMLIKDELLSSFQLRKKLFPIEQFSRYLMVYGEFINSYLENTDVIIDNYLN